MKENKKCLCLCYGDIFVDGNRLIDGIHEAISPVVLLPGSKIDDLVSEAIQHMGPDAPEAHIEKLVENLRKCTIREYVLSPAGDSHEYFLHNITELKLSFMDAIRAALGRVIHVYTTITIHKEVEVKRTEQKILVDYLFPAKPKGYGQLMSTDNQDIFK